MDCSICVEKYNKSTRKPVECPKCQQSSCFQCVKTYITQNEITACLSCGGEWDWDFLYQVLPKTFMYNDYKKLQEKKLLDKELALLPDTQYLVELLNENKHLKRHKIDILNQIADLQQQVLNIDDTIRVNKAEIYGKSIRKVVNVSSGPCPFNECRGFICVKSSKCAVCDTVVCKECREIIISNQEHICKPENIETTKLLKKDSKPCPKCSVFIFKIDGCDQMWCSQCQTAFSWKTGIIESGKIHNPHYYEWQRMTQGSVRRDPDDNGRVLCPRELPDLYYIPRPKEKETVFYNRMSAIHRYVLHIQRAVIPVMDITWDNKILRLDYLLNKISKENMAKELQIRQKERNKNIAVRNCLNLYCENVIEMFHNYIQTRDISSFKEEEKLKEFVNENIKKNEKMYKCKLTKYYIQL